jgi:hypothetical protein
MSVTGVGAVFARIANIETRVGSLLPATLPDFDAILSQAAGERPSEFAATVQSVPRPMTIGDLMGQSFVSSPVSGFTTGEDWTAGLPEAGRRYAAAITDAANAAGVDPALLAALVWTESEFQPDAVSRSGAVGLGQLMPDTAAALGVDPTDPIANLDGAARFLSLQISRFGSLELGLAAYNAGPTRVAQDGGIPDIAETQAYVPKVLSRFRHLGGTS